MTDQTRCPQCGEKGTETAKDEKENITYMQCPKCQYTWVVENKDV